MAESAVPTFPRHLLDFQAWSRPQIESVFARTGRQEAGQTLLHFFQNIKTKLGLLAGLKFVSAVAGPDGDGQ